MKGNKKDRIITRLISEYLWVVGLGLFVVGATKLFTNPWGILIVGAIITLIGVILKSWYNLF